MRRHEVLHILDSAGSEANGITERVALLARRLDPDRYRIHAWFLYGDGPLVSKLRAAGAEVRIVPWKGGLRNPAGAWRFWRALRQERDRFAIVHEHLLGRSLRLLIRGATSAKLVSHLHVIWTRERDGIYKPVRKWNWGAHCVICNSRAAAQILVGAKSRVVYTSVQVAPRSPRQSTKERLGKKVIGTAARLVLIKGVSYLLQAMRILRRENPNLHLEIAGDGPLRSSLEAEARLLALDNAVTFLGWQANLLPVLARWDVYVQPSLMDATPITTLEAMSVGLPVVASNVGGLPEIIIDGETGWLVPPADPAALADRIKRLASCPEQRLAFGMAGHERAKNHFSEAKMVAEIQQIYDDLLNPQSGRARLRASG